MLERISKAIAKVPGIGRVQSITRPAGKPLEYSTIPAQISMGGTNQTMNRSYMQDRMADMLVQGQQMQDTINTMTQMINLMERLSSVTHDMVGKTDQTALDIAELRDHISEFDDFFRPIRNYLYWEPHCYNIPLCWSTRSVFDTLDGVDKMTDDIQQLLPDMHRLDELMPQMVSLMGPTIDSMKRMRVMMLTQQMSQASMQDQQAAMSENQAAMGGGVQRLAQRRHLLPAAGNLRQRRVQARDQELHLPPQRPRGAIHHLPRGRSALRRWDQPHRRDQGRYLRGDQGHAAGRIQGLFGRHRVGIQGHAGRQ